MHPKLEAAFNILKSDTFLINNCLNDIKEEDAYTRPNGTGNSLLFLIGHITASRYSIAKLLGLKEQIPWPDIFSRGVEVSDDTTYPKLTEVLSAYEKISKITTEALESASEELLESKCPVELPTGDGTILGAMSFFALHETYHVGQMAYVRRLLGYSQLVG